VIGARREKYVATFSLMPFTFKIMKILLSIIILLVILLQYRLWSGDGGIEEITALQQRLDDLKEEVEEKKERNEALYAEVEDLRKGQEALEERARDELGMIREGETFFQVLE
jgi:cell division protein FtsB